MDAAQRTTFEPTPENLADEEAAFEAATSTDAPAPVAEETATETEQPAAEVLAEEGEEEDPEAAAPQPEDKGTETAKEPTIADLLAVIEEQKTESQKLRDKVFGKVGELQQKIEAVKSSAGGLHPRAQERLKEDFPELHAMLFGGEGDDEVTAQAATHAPAQAPETSADTEAFTTDQLVEIKVLDRVHTDWRQVVQSPEFNNWKASVLDPKDADTLDDAWDAGFVSDKLTEFKAYQTKQAHQAAQERIKQERLDDATTTRGIPRAGAPSLGDDDEEAAMMASYKPRH